MEEELARKLFGSLIKTDSGPFHTTKYIILNDGYFVRGFYAESDQAAIQMFKDMCDANERRMKDVFYE